MIGYADCPPHPQDRVRPRLDGCPHPAPLALAEVRLVVVRFPDALEARRQRYRRYALNDLAQYVERFERGEAVGCAIITEHADGALSLATSGNAAPFKDYAPRLLLLMGQIFQSWFAQGGAPVAGEDEQPEPDGAC